MGTAVHAAEEPAVKSTASFADVKAGKYYTNAVAWAKESGVVNGKTASSFDPNGEVTREEFATMLYRYLGAEDLALPAIRTGVPADADAVAKCFEQAVTMEKNDMNGKIADALRAAEGQGDNGNV